MGRNQEAYEVIDTIETPRSTWDREFTHKTSFNAGYLVPFYIDTDIIPGTTIKNETSIVIRMATPLYPIMDNLYLDTYWFKCSKYWYWEHFREQMLENNNSAWAQTIEYITPQIKLNDEKYGVNDVATYMGMPIGVPGITWDKTPVQAYIDIWNNWFRSEDLQAPITLDKTDADLDADNTISTGFGLLPVCKFHDYFTASIPQPQKGEPVMLPIGTEAPVLGNGKALGITQGNNYGWWTNEANSSGTTSTTFYHNTSLSNDIGSVNSSVQPTGFNDNYQIGVIPDGTKSGLIADLSMALGASVNAQRFAFAYQRILEKSARFGSRYPESLRSLYGSVASDETLLIAEYLGGKRIAINIQQTIQSVASSEAPLGETGAFSITADVNEDFTKSFSKHDFLIGVLCVRADHTYSQGIPRQFKRERYLDIYQPALAHLGNQPIYNYEIYAQGNNTDNEVFGYKEAWQEYMYKPSRISGEMLPQYAQSLDEWHFGDDYDSLPVLSDEWIREPQKFIDRTLAVSSDVSHQFWCDIFVKQRVSAPIPLNRVPGLIDHF